MKNIFIWLRLIAVYALLALAWGAFFGIIAFCAKDRLEPVVKAYSFSELQSKCPQSFDDLSLGVFENIHSRWDLDKEDWERDDLKLFSILTETPFKLANPTPEKLAVIHELVKWVTEDPLPYTREVPRYIKIDLKKLEIPEDVGELSIGQNIQLKQLIARSYYVEENLSMATAIYLQPLFDESKFIYKRAKELQKTIKEMPAKEVYPVGFFLLSRVRRSGMEAGELLASNPNQPKSEVHKNVASMAKVQLLSRWADLSLPVRYAREFGMDPDLVYECTEMRTLINILAYLKDEGEYHERYSDIYRKIHDGGVRTGTSKGGGED